MTAAIADRVIDVQKRESIAARSRRILHADNWRAVIILACKADASSSTRIREGVDGGVFARRTMSVVAAVEIFLSFADISPKRKTPARESALKLLPVLRE
jgi:hypothetical protein